MLIPEDVIENIRESNDIVDVISEYVALNKKGKNYLGLCPFHKEKTPSFSVLQDKQIFHCFGCGEGGNVISFIMKYRNIGFVDAVRFLADRANIAIPEDNSKEDMQKVSMRQKLYELNRETARFFYIKLQNNSTALNYFKKRGIGADIIKKFGLGYAPAAWDELLKYLKAKGCADEFLEKAGLVVRKDRGGYYDRFRNRVMFPVFDVRGRVIGFGGRVLDDSKPKYLNSPETLVFNKRNNLYGLNLAAAKNIDRRIIIVEGYMDAIALHQYGISNAVASLGTALTREQAKLLKRYCDEVIICYDADIAGQTATLRGLDILADAGCRVKILNIPKGKDPDEYIRSEGREAFEQCIDNSMALIDYKIKRKSENFDISTTEGKIGFLKACAAVLAGIEDPVVIDAYVGKLSGSTGISAQALYKEISSLKNKNQEAEDKHISGKSRYNNIIDGQKLYLEPAYIKAEKYILCMLCEDNSKFDYISKALSYEDFNDELYREVARLIYNRLENKNEANPAYIISCFQEADDMKKVSEIFNSISETDNDDIDKVIGDYIKIIKRNKLMKKRDLLVINVKELERKGDVQQSTQLLKEVMDIEKQLREL